MSARIMFEPEAENLRVLAEKYLESAESEGDPQFRQILADIAHELDVEAQRVEENQPGER